MKPETLLFLAGLAGLYWITKKSINAAVQQSGAVRYYENPITGAGAYVNPGDPLYSKAADIDWEH
jgi:hypothetical protein